MKITMAQITILSANISFGWNINWLWPILLSTMAYKLNQIHSCFFIPNCHKGPNGFSYSSGSRGGGGAMVPPGPVGHKKDGRQRRPHRFHVSRPPPYPATGSATELYSGDHDNNKYCVKFCRLHDLIIQRWTLFKNDLPNNGQLVFCVIHIWWSSMWKVYMQITIRMHSSRMRTVRCRDRLVGGGVCLGDVHLPVNRMTDRCKSITTSHFCNFVCGQ